MPKIVPKSFKKLADSELMASIINRASDPSLAIANVLDHWAYDLYERKPGPAYYNSKTGELHMTDLDLACFLSALADRHAVINLPTYSSRRAPTVRTGEFVVSKDNRHGKVIGLSSNAGAFSFSIKIFDANVIVAGRNGEEDSVGAYRNFMLVDVDGQWYDGWKSIQFLPTAQENDFLSNKKLWTGHTIHFKNFVHPNRWSSFYGSHYLQLKTLITRLEEEAVFLRTEIKRLQSEGILFPPSGGSQHEASPTESGLGKSITVDAFACEVDAPFVCNYPSIPSNQEALVSTSRRVKEIQYTILPKLRFHARATELAFVQHGGLEAGFPSWIESAKWEVGYRLPRGRTDWNRLVFHQARVGELGYALRCRNYSKTEIVNIDS